MIISILKLFKENYNAKDYGIAERDSPALCVYICGERHKVVDTYRNPGGQSYFVVYKKVPIKERKNHGFIDNKETCYFHGEVNRMLN